MSFRSIFASFLKDIVNYEAPSHRSYANSSSLLSSPRIHSLLIFVIVRYVVSFATFHPNPKAPSASKKGGIGKALEKGIVGWFPFVPSPLPPFQSHPSADYSSN
mmetsp:Transcript_23756/g.42334  ORF Transcript_23756/g.42334 Transcript_23756/m.42334 type:complete len:104 (+) Transcript_23756:127-438(+)